MITLVDDLGRALTLTGPARRVVSLVPSLTETLFALGCGGAVCGATRYCVEPADQMTHVRRVGGTKNPDIERIVALDPDLVLINPEENRRADFDALERAGLNLCVLFPHRVADVPRMLRHLGTLVGAEVQATHVAAGVEGALAEAAAWRNSVRVRVFCPIWKNPWMSVNRKTFVDDVLWLAGGYNVCREAAERYCTVKLEDIAAAAPDVILLPDEPYAFGAEDVSSLVPLRETPAARTRRIHFVDGKALAWYGPRTTTAVRLIHRLLHLPADAAGAAHE